MSPESFGQNQSEARSCSRELIFGKNLELIAYGVAHTQPYLESNRTFIEKTIDEADFVAVESDMNRLSNKESVEATGFFDSIFDIAWNNQKLVICSDPAPEMGFLTAATAITSVVSFMPPLLLGGSLTYDLATQPITRRQFLKLGGFLASMVVFKSSILSQWMDSVLVGCEGRVSHPQTADKISFGEFRDSTSLAGFGMLAEAGIPKLGKGILFQGEFHINDFAGYADNEVVDIEKCREAMRSNVYTHLAKSINIIPSIRIWKPENNVGEFKLMARVPIV